MLDYLPHKEPLVMARPLHMKRVAATVGWCVWTLQRYVLVRGLESSVEVWECAGMCIDTSCLLLERDGMPPRKQKMYVKLLSWQCLGITYSICIAPKSQTVVLCIQKEKTAAPHCTIYAYAGSTLGCSCVMM